MHYVIKITATTALLIYACILIFFAFRPFHRIPGLSQGFPSVGLEDRDGGKRIRKKLVQSGVMSLEVLARPAADVQYGPAVLVAFAQDNLSENFALGQHESGLSFRLRTTDPEVNGLRPGLHVRDVFSAGELIHLVLVYDGSEVRLYVNGAPHPEKIPLHGSFDTWGENHLLTVNDLVTGGPRWRGIVRRFTVYDRPLDPREISLLYAGGEPDGSVYAYRRDDPQHTMKTLRYRNLFRTVDPVFNVADAIANVVAFIPFVPVLYWSAPRRLKALRYNGAILLFICLGAAVSLFIELSQSMIISRVPCALDIYYNTSGAMLGGMAVMGCRKRARKRAEKG